MTANLQPDETEVRTQLARILASGEFRQAPVLTRMLRCIVDAALEGSAGQLNASVLARKALGKSPDFQSSKDPSVRVAANRMRRSLRLYYADAGRCDDIEIALEPGSYEPAISYRAAPQQTLSDRALNAVDHYQSVATRQSLATTLGIVEAALAAQPEEARLLAAKADLLMDFHKHGLSNGSRALDLAHDALKRASEIEPDERYVVLASAFAALLDGDGTAVEALANELVQNSREPKDIAFGVWALTLVSECGAAICKAQPQLFDRHDLPGWIHHAPFLSAYTEGDYETALGSAMAFGMPQFFWSGIDRTAALGQLGLKAAAKRELKRTADQCPHLFDRTDRIISTYIPCVEAREHVIEGLEKAGLSSLH